MSKFCSNCGNAVDEKAVICIKCGVSTNNVTQNTQKQPGKGLGIASMVLGIVAAWNSLGTLFIFSCFVIAGEYLLPEEKLALILIFLMIPLILLIIGLIFGFISRSKVKNGINLTGLLLSFISLAICILSILIICLI